jgi:hypothetical protein
MGRFSRPWLAPHGCGVCFRRSALATSLQVTYEVRKTIPIVTTPLGDRARIVSKLPNKKDEGAKPDPAAATVDLDSGDRGDIHRLS